MHNLQFPYFTFVAELQKVSLEKNQSTIMTSDSTTRCKHTTTHSERRGARTKSERGALRNVADICRGGSGVTRAACYANAAPPTQTTEPTSLTSTRTLFLLQSARGMVLLTLLLTAVCRFE